MPVYSFGVQSPLKFQLSEEYADSYNRALRAFYAARNKFKEETGEEWTPEKDLLELDCAIQDQKTFFEFHEILAQTLERCGMTLEQAHIIVDHLIQN